MYCIPVAIIIMGLLLLFLSGETLGAAIGLTFSFMGAVGVWMILFVSGTPDHTQNIENLKTNIQKVYDVDDVTMLDKELKNGDTIKISDDGKTFEVFVNWDLETYKPTIAPTTATVEEIAELEK